MKLYLGKNLRQLRRDRDLTQEDLAEVLKVSYQSVSRWENDACYPDMELIPVIASFFGVTVDQLLGVNQAIEEQKVAAYMDQFQSAISAGDITSCIEIARKGISEFPGNFALMNKLMYALFVSTDEDGNIPNWEENKNRYDAEITSLGETIMKFCPEQEIRLEATARLGFHHCEAGRMAQGRAILETLPTTQFCKENWIWWGLDEEEKLPHTRWQISRGYSTMRAGMYNLTSEHLLPDEQLIQVYEKMYELDRLVFGEYAMDAHHYHAQTRCQMAAVYARMGAEKKALEQLEIASQAARAFDQRPEEGMTDSLLLGERTWHRTDFETSDTRTCCEIMVEKWMQTSDFDKIRNTPDFEQIVRMLKNGNSSEEMGHEK